MPRNTSPNAYIFGFPTEFDLLILEKGSQPEKFTNAYKPEKVICGIEVKANGIYGGKSNLKRVINSIKQIFLSVNKEYEKIKFIYFTFQEVTSPKKQNSINYLNETKKYLEPYKVICLKDSRNGTVFVDQWQKFINYIKY